MPNTPLTEYAHQCGLSNARVIERHRFYSRIELYLEAVHIGTYRTHAQCRAAIAAIARVCVLS